VKCSGMHSHRHGQSADEGGCPWGRRLDGGRVRISGNFTPVLNRHRQASGSCVREKLCDRRVRASIRASRSLLFSIPGSALFLFWNFLLPDVEDFFIPTFDAR
jgi:hypothetical protein